MASLGAGLGLGLNAKRRRILRPPAGFVFITDADGRYLTDADGAYLIEPA